MSTPPIYVGGLRDRLIHDSIYNWVQNGLALLGWLDPGRQHQPITFLKEMKTWEEQLPPNTITIAPADQTDEDFELGSFGFKNDTIYYIDVYAEDIDGRNSSLGQHLSGDIRDLLRGNFDSIGYGHPTVPILDYTQATPSEIFYVDVTKVRRDRAVAYPKRFQRQLWTIEMTVTDWYWGQSGADLDGGNVQEYYGAEVDGGNAADDDDDYYGGTIEGGSADG
jgi:hypothetical protein